MYDVDLYAKVRRAVLVEAMRERTSPRLRRLGIWVRIGTPNGFPGYFT